MKPTRKKNEWNECNFEIITQTINSIFNEHIWDSVHTILIFLSHANSKYWWRSENERNLISCDDHKWWWCEKNIKMFVVQFLQELRQTDHFIIDTT